MKRLIIQLLVTLVSIFFFPALAFSQEYFDLKDLENLASTNDAYEIEKIANDKDYYRKGDLYADVNRFVDKFKNELSTFQESDITLHNAGIKISNPSKQLINRYLLQIKKYYFLEDDKSPYYYANEGRYMLTYKHDLKKNTLEIKVDLRSDNHGWPMKVLSPSKVEINSFTTYSSIYVKKGDKVYLSAEGEISLGTFAGISTPDGIEGYQSYSISQNSKHGSLIASIYVNDKPTEWLSIGSYKSFTANASGTLILRVNDNDRSNNEGSYVITYGINKIIPAPAKTTIAETKPETPKPAAVIRTEPKTVNPTVTKDAILASLNGEWKGSELEIGNGKQYEIRLSVNPADNTCKVNYPSLGCSGVWNVSSEGGNDMLFKERILSGTNVCVQGVFVKLVVKDNQKIDFFMYYPTLSTLVGRGSIMKQ